MRKNNKSDNTFYVCSYGGCGSKMLQNALKQYGQTRHIHSRFPPEELEYVGNWRSGPPNSEWFNGIAISENQLHKYHVIYIYRNPSFSIPSRFKNPKHLTNIQIDKTIKLDDVYESGQDLYQLNEFHNNYLKPTKPRNYKVYCVKYEDIFDKQDELSELLKIGKLNIINTSKRVNSDKKLDIIYTDLIQEMKQNDSIIIV